MQSFKKPELRALANHLFYFGYGIAERLPIAASPGGRSRIRADSAEGSEQEAERLSGSAVWEHFLKPTCEAPHGQPRGEASSAS